MHEQFAEFIDCIRVKDRGGIIYGELQLWQYERMAIKRGELLTDDYCQDCGKELFDQAGKASMPVIKDYI